MRSYRVLGCLLCAVCAGTALAENIRSGEIVRRDCHNSSGHAEITLFENGTLRLRQTQKGEEDRFELAELGPDELQGFENRLRAVDLSEVDPGGRAEMGGDLVEECDIHLFIDDEEGVVYRFGRFDSLPLSLSHLNGIVNDMLQYVEDHAPEIGLPPDYKPKRGDILARHDGALFEVIGLTSDKRGVELIGVDQPLTIFVARDSLRDMFTSLEKRRRW
ncbi:MAG: hypothetical protein P8Y44_03640 [Acidobacteriota bacterium]